MRFVDDMTHPSFNMSLNICNYTLKKRAAFRLYSRLEKHVSYCSAIIVMKSVTNLVQQPRGTDCRESVFQRRRYWQNAVRQWWVCIRRTSCHLLYVQPMVWRCPYVQLDQLPLRRQPQYHQHLPQSTHRHFFLLLEPEVSRKLYTRIRQGILRKYQNQNVRNSVRQPTKIIFA